MKYHRAAAANFALVIPSLGGAGTGLGCTCAGDSDGAFKDPSYLPPSAALPLKLRADTAALGLLAFPLSPALQQRGFGFLQSRLGAVTPRVGLVSRPLLCPCCSRVTVAVTW